jgi:hypothetical protein
MVQLGLLPVMGVDGIAKQRGMLHLDLGEFFVEGDYASSKKKREIVFSIWSVVMWIKKKSLGMIRMMGPCEG